MAIIDKIKVGSTTYDVSPSASGTLNTTGTTKFASSDTAQASATSWTNVDKMTTADNHATLFTKITQMAKNVRYLYNVLGTGFSTGSTVKGQIDGKAPANHSHSVSQLPTSSTQVNSNDYIPTSALIYSMNQTLTSLNDASIKIKDVKTTDRGVYSTTDNIAILSIIHISIGITDDFSIYYSIIYINKSNTTNIYCYHHSSYVDHASLNRYINHGGNAIVFVYPNDINEVLNLRLYYINK